MSGVRRALALIAVLTCFAAAARLMAPFAPERARVLVPPDRYLDATLATLVVADGVDKLQSAPRRFYDTAILYPDRTQLRTTEPFLGFALLALPFKTVLRLDDADVFEMLRWTMLWVALVYAFWLFRAGGVDVCLSAAGAVLCLCQPNLLIGIARLQLLSIPLLLPVAYHALMVWAGRRPQTVHAVALFAWLALYPLFGILNAVIAVVAAALLLPLLARASVDLWRERRLPALAVPIAAAVLVDAIVLAPWLFDRADMSVYSSPAFLAIKRWNPTFVPLRVSQLTAFVEAPVGIGITTAFGIVAALIAAARVSWRRGQALQAPAPTQVTRTHTWTVPALMAAMAVLASYGVTRDEVVGLGVAFDAACVLALLAWWRAQARVSRPGQHGDLAPLIAVASAGLAVFLALVSFGPVYVSNRHPLASGITTALLEIVPPMKAMREFDRAWIFAVLFASIYAVVTIACMLRRRPLIRGCAAALLLAAAGIALSSRPLVASPPIEAPMDLVTIAARSPRTGALYVHPYMKWNSRSGVLMIAIARALRRPIVNGYLGVEPPWFAYATEVLHRYPDPEALWLLGTWKVDTVLTLVGDVQLEQLTSPFGQGDAAVEEIPPAADLRHPSRGAAPANGETRVDGAWTDADREGTRVVRVVAPGRFAVSGVEIHFEPTPASLMPASVDIYEAAGARRTRLNEGQSGQWLRSLAADALLRREWPVATVMLTGPTQGPLELDFHNAANPSVARIVLAGTY